MTKQSSPEAENSTAPAEGRSIVRSPKGGEGSGGGPPTHTRAQLLRKNSTGPERKLWAALGRLRERGFHLRRQVKIGKYIADFASHRERLVIEVDGAQHYEEGHQERDAARTRFLEGRGYRVLRYSNYEVLQNIPGVMREVFEVLTERRRLKFGQSSTAVPPPDPSSPRGLRTIDRPSAGAVEVIGQGPRARRRTS